VPAGADVFALAGGRDLLLAGGRGCVYRRQGRRWETLPLKDPEGQVWSIAVDPRAPATVFAGCRPLALWRSEDAGERWEELSIRLPAGLPAPHTPRVTSIVVEPDAIWCGVEVGGVLVSGNGGGAWTPANDGLPSLDIHALARDRGLLAATPRGIARLGSPGGAWTVTDLRAPWTYCRALAAGPRGVLCGLGDGPPGTRGAVVVSEDDGRSWHSALFPGAAASTVWSLAVAADGSDLALAAAIRGELFDSEDAGRTWQRLARAFREVRAAFIA
jgi:photosystem II stability/assembly factor-like uncharacterized protein